MKKTNGFLMAVVAATMALTFSCSSDDGDCECGDSSSSVGSSGDLSSSSVVVGSSSSGGGGSSSSVVVGSSSSGGGSSSSVGGNQFNPNIQYIEFINTRDNTTYKSVVIGTQTWMAENLNYDVPNNATDVCYGNDPANCAKYGRLYTWGDAVTACPDGWHLPSDTEWDILVNYAGGSETAGKKLKSIIGWDSNNGTDDYGFSALPGGYSNGTFFNVGANGFWWSSTEVDSSPDAALGRSMIYYVEYVDKHQRDKAYLHSVRCMQDLN